MTAVNFRNFSLSRKIGRKQVHTLRSERSPTRMAARTARIYQQVENLERAFPVFGLGILQIGIDDLEGARQGQAQSAGDGRKPGVGLFAVGEVERRGRGDMIQDRPQLDLLVELHEVVNALLQSFGNREIDELDESRPFAFATASARMRRSSRHHFLSLT